MWSWRSVRPGKKAAEALEMRWPNKAPTLRPAELKEMALGLIGLCAATFHSRFALSIEQSYGSQSMSNLCMYLIIILGLSSTFPASMSNY